MILKQKLLIWKRENAGLECRLELAKEEFENMEIKKEELIRVISKNKDEIETLVAKERLFNNKVSSLSRENTDLKKTIDESVLRKWIE